MSNQSPFQKNSIFNFITYKKDTCNKNNTTTYKNFHIKYMSFYKSKNRILRHSKPFTRKTLCI